MESRMAPRPLPRRESLPWADTIRAMIPRLLLTLLAGSLLWASEPVVFNDDGGWCWYQDERVLVVNGKPRHRQRGLRAQ
jgi:hypothetical protein